MLPALRTRPIFSLHATYLEWILPLVIRLFQSQEWWIFRALAIEILVAQLHPLILLLLPRSPGTVPPPPRVVGVTLVTVLLVGRPLVVGRPTKMGGVMLIWPSLPLRPWIRKALLSPLHLPRVLPPSLLLLAAVSVGRVVGGATDLPAIRSLGRPRPPVLPPRTILPFLMWVLPLSRALRPRSPGLATTPPSPTCSPNLLALPPHFTLRSPLPLGGTRSLWRVKQQIPCLGKI